MENEWMEKLAIQELLARYAHAIDDLKPEVWVRCFTSDGIFQLGSRVLRGHDALRAYGEIHAREMRYRHMIGNFLYEVMGNEATFISTAILIGELDAHFYFEEFLHAGVPSELKPKLLAVRYQRELKKRATLTFERGPFVQFLD